MYENQPNLTKLLIFNDLLKNNTFIKKNTKKNYYQLLIDSFNDNKINDHSEQISKIKELFEKNKSNDNDFEEIDMYIELFIAENENKNEVENFNEEGIERDFFEKINNKKKDLNIIIPENNYLYENNNLSSINSPNPLKNQNNK